MRHWLLLIGAFVLAQVVLAWVVIQFTLKDNVFEPPQEDLKIIAQKSQNQIEEFKKKKLALENEILSARIDSLQKEKEKKQLDSSIFLYLFGILGLLYFFFFVLKSEASNFPKILVIVAVLAFYLPLMKGIVEQQSQITTLKKEISSLNRETTTLKKEISSLERYRGLYEQKKTQLTLLRRETVRFMKETENKKKQKSQNPAQQKPSIIPENKEQIKRGYFSDYEYTYSEREGKIAVSFSPFLPRNDAIVTGAMLDVINTVYGKHLISDLTPRFVNRGGTNLIQFSGINHYFYFLLIKQDTGEIHSFSLWRERKPEFN